MDSSGVIVLNLLVLGCVEPGETHDLHHINLILDTVSSELESFEWKE